MKIYIKIFLIQSFCILLLFGCNNVNNKIKNNSEQPYVIMLSMDGFRWDYPEKAKTPTLDSIARNGIRANSIPCFPTKTFPNHYSIVTGLYPENHGIILNEFYSYELEKKYSMHDRQAVEDADFYKGEPIWVTAEKQNVTTASYFWVGSESPVKVNKPTYWKKYDHYFPFESIIDSVIFWLDLPDNKRPHLILFYFNEPDETGHKYGPNSAEIVHKVEYLDSILGVFFNKINKLPIADQLNIIVTSDHGMCETSLSSTIYFDDYVSTEWIKECYGGSPVYIIKSNDGFEDSTYFNLKKIQHCSVYYPNEIPEYLHYNNNINIQDFILVADSSWSIEWKNQINYYDKGRHGYDNKNTDMHAIFYAIGPVFKKNYKHKSFENINIYSLIAEILNIEPVKTDGKLEEVSEMLNK